MAGFYRFECLLQTERDCESRSPRTFVFLDERAETLSEAAFYLTMDGSPERPGTTTFYDYPGCSHNGAASLSFADGHTE